MSEKDKKSYKDIFKQKREHKLFGKYLEKKYKGAKFMQAPKLVRKASGGIAAGIRRFNKGGKV